MRHNSSLISFQTSRMASSFLKLRLPENNYLYKIVRIVWRLESNAGNFPFPRTTRTIHQRTTDEFHKYEHRRQKLTMIEHFCKAPSLEFPPHPYIEQLATHAHACISTYIKLWRIRDNENKIYIEQCNNIELLGWANGNDD